MITFCLFSRRFAFTLVTLLATLQITACGTENLATAITPNIGSNSATEATSDENAVTTNIALSWVAPVAREDNSPLSLSAIAGYKIYYGTTPGQYPNSANINDGSATSYIFNNFSSATYYFVVTTIDVDGRESQYSSEVIFTI